MLKSDESFFSLKYLLTDFDMGTSSLDSSSDEGMTTF